MAVKKIQLSIVVIFALSALSSSTKVLAGHALFLPCVVSTEPLLQIQTEQPISNIREKVTAINQIKKWSKIEKAYLEGSTEGGEASFFYLKKQLIKINTVQMGETFRLNREYYFSDSKLIFVFERIELYIKPLDRSHSSFFDSRKYFQNNQLIHRLNSKNVENPLNLINIKEDQKEILSTLNKIRLLQPDK